MIRISNDAKAKIAEIAKATGSPMTDVVDDAVEQLERKIFFDRLKARYTELRADPAAWAEIEAERREWDSTLRDGSE